MHRSIDGPADSGEPTRDAARTSVPAWVGVVVGAGALVLAATLVALTSGQGSLAAVTLLGALAAWLAWSEANARGHLRRVAQEGAKLLPDSAASTLRWHADPVADLAAVYGRLLEQIGVERGLLRDELRRRTRAEEELRETEERYALAVSGANDGMWEWNLKTGTAHFSARWKSMLGYGEAEISSSIEEWRGRIHPDDREHTLAALEAHVRGALPRFECEHRIRHKNGGWRWVLARAAVVRHANGNPYRIVGLNTDVSARRQARDMLFELADGLGDLRGDEAYRTLVRSFAMTVGTREAFLAECANFPTTRVRTLAHWSHDTFVPSHAFDLAGTPCEQVICNGRPLIIPNKASERFEALRPLGTECYVGLPCVDTKGLVIGHIVCEDPAELCREIPHDAILKLFAVRASVELERQLLARARRSGASGAGTTPTLH